MLVEIEARILIFPGTDFHFFQARTCLQACFRLWVQGSLLTLQPLYDTIRDAILTCARKPT